MEEVATGRPVQRQRGSPIVVTGSGAPGVGKTTLFQALQYAFRAIGIGAEHIDQDRPSEAHLGRSLMQMNRMRLQEKYYETTDPEEKKRLRGEISTFFLADLRLAYAQVRSMADGIILLEHSAHFSLAIDIVRGVSRSQLKHNYQGLPMGNFGIFLDASPSMYARHRGNPSRDLRRDQATYEIMKSMAYRDLEYWVRIDALQSKEKVFQDAMGAICIRYRDFLDGYINKIRQFSFPGST